jgi:hypothetical protein
VTTHSPFGDLGRFAARFAACEIPHAEWTHEAHLAVGTWYVDRYGPEEALDRLRGGIRRLNDSHGTPNSTTRGYHETITRAYVLLIAEFLESAPPAMPLGERLGQLLAGPIAERDVLLRFWSRERLLSPQARAGWLEPDLAPVELAAVYGGAER